MTHVTVHQLSSEWGKSILNVSEGPLYVYVWGCNYKSPTYLLQNGIHFMLIQFDDEAMEKEWMEENQDKYTKITKVEEVERKDYGD
jgi:hypothetical protein